MSRTIGFAAEQQGRDYLVAQGLRWIISNYQCCWGEIDLIMQDNNCLVFVEVRTRTSVAFGGAAASITKSKQRKILKTAMHYLAVNQLYENKPVRFDVLSMNGSPLLIDWIPNAFGLDF